MINLILKELFKRGVIALAATGAAILGIQDAKAANFSVVASGLDSPRGLTFGPDGALYVAEAGRGGEGPCIPSPSIPGAVLCYGSTGAIAKVEGSTFQRIVTGLPSVASLNSVIPDGSDASGPHDIQFDSNGNAYVITGLASNPANRDDQLGIADFGQILALKDLASSPSWSPFADLANFELNNNPDGDLSPGGINTNPFYMTIEGKTAWAIDAGGNSLLSVDLDTGDIEVAAVFPSRNIGTAGEEIFMQSVPTSVAIGPDGAFYVTELTGVPFPKNGARIYRIDGGTPQVFLDGFTNLIDLAFADNGDLFVLEYTTNTIFSGDPTGALIQIKPNGDRTTILQEGLINPTALVIGLDNSIYISHKSFLPGQGEIIRLRVATPEPASVLGLSGLVILSIGSGWCRRRKLTRNQ